MNLFSLDWMSFFLVGIGTMLLVGELLVRAKGLLGITGFMTITIYFYAYLEPSMFWTMVFIYFLGVTLIFLDGEFINDGLVAGIGVLLMIISVGLTSPNWVSGLYAISGVFIGGSCSFLWLIVLPRRDLWSKITLIDRLTDDQGYSSMSTDYRGLVDQRGICLTDLRPVGTIKINDMEYSAITNGYWIEKDTEVIVKQVDGTRVLVSPVFSDQDTRLEK